jgi:lysophospholipase L1-like esterase
VRNFLLRLTVGLAAHILAPAAFAGSNPAPDPAAVGPFSVTRVDYDFGATALQLPDLPRPVEVTASVHHPTDLTAGPFSLVLFIHGMHYTCFEGTYRSFNEWPCVPPHEPIPSYRGYDYIGSVLASHGYIVVSISANGVILDSDAMPDLGMHVRAQLIHHHLQLWRAFALVGAAPFGDRFVGAVDLEKIGLMGHSRGGEGVSRFVLLNQEQKSPVAVKAALLLAPTNFNRFVINHVPLATVVPYCDSEVEEVPGVHYLDDARYSAPGDRAAKYTIVLGGANHNFFNTYWTSEFFSPGSWDDSVCHDMPTHLDSAQQRAAALAYTAAFFRLHLGGETQFAAMLRGDDAPPLSAATQDILISRHAPDTPQERRDLNRTLDGSSLALDALGQPITATGLSEYSTCGGGASPQHCLPNHRVEQQPHTAGSLRSTRVGLNQIRLAWDLPTASLEYALPAAAANISGFFALQVRAGVDFADPRNPAGAAQDFSIVLIDGSGRQAATTAGLWTKALAYPAGSGTLLPRVILNAVRVPLFAFGGVDLTDIRRVQFRFDQRQSGALLMTDFAFTDVAVSQMSTTPTTNAPPIITLTTPEAGTAYSAGSTLMLEASAHDADGQVVRVAFYNGSSLLGEVTDEPFRMTWPAVVGSHAITAVAWDNNGASGASAPVIVEVGELPRVMPLGDSITDGLQVPGGYRTELWRLLAKDGVTIDFVGSLNGGPETLPDRDHMGVSGIKIAQLTASMDGLLATHTPDVVLLMVGANDMWHNDDVANAPARLSTLIDRIFLSRPGATVVVAKTPPWSDSLVHSRIVTYNAGIPNVVAAHQALGRAVILVDMYAVVPVSDLYDGVHPSAEGQRKVAAVWYSAIRPFVRSSIHLPPRVALTSPAAGTHTATSISLSASSPDDVTEVEFLANGISVGIASAPPFQFEWNNVPAGDYSIVARARDRQGAIGISAAVPITLIMGPQPPTVRLTAPTSDTLFRSPATITLTAEASAPGGGIARVEFFAGTTLLGHATAPPYTLSWSGAAKGAYQVIARAWNFAGESSTSPPVTVRVDALRVMPLGDSISTGVGMPEYGGYRVELWNKAVTDGLAIDFVGSQTDGPATLPDRQHEGHSGARIDGISAGVNSWLTNSNPDVVLLLIGTNDIWQNTDLQNAPARLGALIDQILSRKPGVAIVVSSIPRWSDSVQNAKVIAYNAAIPGIVSERQALGHRVLYVDSYEALMLSDLQDGVHPNETGYAKMAEVWYAALRPLLLSTPVTPPQVQLTNPAADAKFIAPGTVTLTATATDSDGVSEVEFLANGTTIGRTSSAPFTFTWTGAPTGQYTLGARARDRTGVFGESSSISITVSGSNLPPSVSLTAPAAGARFDAPASITLTADAVDAEGSVTRVDFYAGTAFLGRATAAPYSITWTGVAAGVYEVTARATDNAEATSSSQPLVVSVSTSTANQPPTVRITAPAFGTHFGEPATIELVAEAGDLDGTIASVEFLSGASSIGKVTSPPYKVTWNAVPAGVYDVTARAVDSTGASSTSAGIQIRVGTLRVMPLGDSLTDGKDVPGAYRIELWRQLQSAGRTVDFVGSQRSGPLSLPDLDHEGHRGWTIDDLRANLTSWLTTYQPDVVLLMAGANDVIENNSVATAPERLGLLIDKIFELRPTAAVIVSTTLYMSNPVEQAEVLAFNAALPNVIAARRALGRRVVLVDLAPVVPLTDMYDGIHPTAEGHRKLGVGWYRALMHVLTNNVPPAVSLAEPVNGANLSLSAPFTLRASASDQDGSVSSVEFFSNGTSLGSAGPPNFALQWTPATAGAYELVARARDAAGGSTLSAAVSVNVAAANQPPTVQLLTPVDASSFVTPATIVLKADAADTDGTISRVEFHANSVFLGQATAVPYQFTWSSVPVGTHVIKVVAYDDDGARNETGPITVVVTLPKVSIEARDAFAAETGPNTGEFVITRSGGLQSALTVGYVVSGTATPGADYTALSGTATIGVGVDSTRIVVTPLTDAVGEGDETVVLTLKAGTTYTIDQGTAAIVIADRPTVTMQATADSIREGAAANAAFRVTRTGNTSQSLSVSVYASGSATAHSDYRALPTVATIPAGAVSVDIPLVVIDDVAAEKSEMVTLRVLASSAYLVGSPDQASITIADDEPMISITASDASAAEPGTDSATFTISRAEPSAKAVTVYFGVSGTASHGGDYKYIGTSATIAAGATSVTLTVAPINDFVVEKPETSIVTLFAHSSYTIAPPAAATVTIDDDEPTVSVSASDITASEPGTDTGAFVITRTGSVAAPLTVFWSLSGTATHGVDYKSLGSQVTIPAGADRVTLVVTAVNDLAAEKPETVTLTLYSQTSYSIGSSSATITISDDEPTVTISTTDNAAAEPGVNTGAFTVTLSSASPAPLTVYFRTSGTAVHGVDYRSVGSFVTIPAGGTSATVTVTSLNDAAAEAPETMGFELTASPSYTIGAPSLVTMTLEDDEPIVSVSASDPDASEAGANPGAFLISRTRTVATALTVYVALSGTATNGYDYTYIGGSVTIPAGSDGVSVPVKPLLDTLVESAETVTIAIAAQPTYLLGATRTATVTIR